MHHPTHRRDLLLAFLLAAFMTACWAAADWSRLSRLVLPDADDMMRLAQVRDWLAGQAFDDWTQYRMAPPLGAPMHWSRVNDFGIAALILAGTPVLGRHGAEVAAVIGYPALLFGCSIFLSMRIARQLWSPAAAVVAALLAVLAYPGITLFVPGRVDHHALQIVLTQAATLMLMRGARLREGLLAGLFVATSLVIGLETAPQAVALAGALALLWTVRGDTERLRLAGFAAGLGGATLLALLALRPSYWSAALCDAFTPASSSAALAVAAALALLAAATPRLDDWRRRLAAGAVLGAVAAVGVLFAFPACLSGPYGAMDPFLRAAFLPHIDEANGIGAQPLGRALAIGGLLAAGCLASAWMVLRAPRRWATMLPVVAVVATSALVMLAQVRGTYIGAPAAVPVLAGLVVAARRAARWRTALTLAAWLVSAGIAWEKVPHLAAWTRAPGKPIPGVPATPQALCNEGDVWAQVDRYPPGVVMAPTNMASYLIGATHLSTVGAGYHRNDRGNMAMYRYFLGPPERAAGIARAWRVTYVAFCPGDFAEIEVTARYPHSLAAMLQADRAPAGFRQLPLRGARLRLYRLTR